MAGSYHDHATGLRVLPGKWRPHYPWEHIGWVSPSWPSQDYVWLDFPEAIFTARGLHYLSHVNPGVPALYPDWPPVEWDVHDNGISFQRMLPDGISFGGSITKGGEHHATLELFIRNDSPEPLTRIKLQTCCFLRACREFADYTQENKYVHTADAGWMSFKAVMDRKLENGTVMLGWRSGPKLADRPVMVCRSNAKEERYVAMTWGESTIALIGNPGHPCLHADPYFPDLEPGRQARITGTLLFHMGPLDSLPATF